MSWPIGISTGGYRECSILDVLPAIRAAGVSGIEIGTPPGHFDPTDNTEVQRLADALKANGLEAVSIHAPFGSRFDLAHPDADHRSAGMAATLASARALSACGGGLVIVHPSDLPRHDHDAIARLQDALVSLTSIADTCSGSDVQLVVESPLPHLIGGHPDEFAWLLARLPESVGVCLDTGHTFLGRHWRPFVTVAGSRLVHVHANDNRSVRDDHLPPGDGAIDWRDITGSLHEAHFNGWIMLELADTGLDAVTAHLDRAVRQARDLLQQ